VAGLVEGKAGLVTGAASGIGRASAVAFGREGASVAVCDLEGREEEGRETVRLVEQAGGRALWVPCDVSRSTDCEGAVAQTVAAFGGLDFAVNNAGVGPLGSIVDTDEEAFDRVIAVNLKGVWLGMRHEIRQMLAQGGGGAIVNTASVAGISGAPNSAAYVASKHGVVGLTRAAAVEHGADGIRVNAVCPALTRTGMSAGLPDDVREVLLAMQAIQREADPDEIAAAIVWLCSDQASFVTGIAMPVDAGTTASAGTWR
jgi:NAD(P)-dependent dehydrogenase (short-subunit alcohol dehydrogenase family)